MGSPQSPQSSIRRHARNISHPLRQNALRDPLEDAGEDPLADTPTGQPGASVSEATQSVQSIDSQAATAPELEADLELTRRLLFLQDPDLYNQLFTNEIPAAYFETNRQPPIDSSLPDLLQGGHFRFAAEKALRDLLASDSDPAEYLLQLLYIRLACLVLISRPDLAAQEAAPLLDFLERSPPGTQDILPFIPWDLRLLLVRLQNVSAADGGRRGVMALYALAGEVRSNIRIAKRRNDNSAVSTWQNRLQDLGLRVCDAFVEMGELETATRHLETLHYIDADELTYRKALLRVRVGDVTAAGRCADDFNDDAKKKSIKAIIDVADGDFSAQSWQSLVEEYPSHELFAQNAAIALLYTGHIASARDVLEDLATRLPTFPTLLFNLSTIYELCSERSAESKTALTQQAAAKTPVPDSGGWERANYEFKL